MAQGHAMQLTHSNTGMDITSTDVIQTTNGSEIVAPTGTLGKTPDQSTGNVDKIRDILFGSQIREYETRFARLEETISKELADIRETAKKRADAIETYVTREFESLQARLKSERDERADAHRQLSREIADHVDTIARRIGDLDEKTSQTERQLRLELLQAAKSFTEDLARKQEETAAIVERRFQELRKGKTDRAALSAMFIELGMRLNNEFQSVAAEA